MHFLRILTVLIIFQICLTLCLAYVDLEVAVLQYDNPSGTSYHGMNYTSNRKCCDTGATGSDCSQASDTCDVVFAFCIGIIDPGSSFNGCNGSYIDMKESIKRNLNHINSTQRKNLIRMSSMSWWDNSLVYLTANIFDDDAVNGGSFASNRELVDVFSKPLNITPAANLVQSKGQTKVLINEVSLALSIRVWCSPGWYGDSCQHHCNYSFSGSFHNCAKNGSLKPVDSCSSKDLLVLSLQATPLDILPLSNIQRKLVVFTATNVCPPHTQPVTVTLHDIQYRQLSPSESVVDVEFFALCNVTTVSRLKFTETVYILNQHQLYQEYPGNMFNVPVISPKVSVFGVHQNLTTIYFMVRVVKLEMKTTQKYQMTSLNHVLNFCFPKAFCKAVTVYSGTNNMRDCNGDLVDVDYTQLPSTVTPKSTMLYSLSSSPDTLLISIYNETMSGRELSFFNISLNKVEIQTYFSMALPYTYTNTVNNTSLSLEILSWCGNRNGGPHCFHKRPSNKVGPFRTACTDSNPCQNNGICQDGVCICPNGWTGVTCTVDMDECEIGTCVNSDGCQNTPGNYKCNCTKGFGGQNCDQDIDECKSSPCQKDSTCLNTYGGFRCICAKYWKGPFCNVSDFCSQGICEHSATCSESAGDFTCTCKPGWTNKTCNQDVNECSQNICNNKSSTDCFNIPGSFTCKCKQGYVGSKCERNNICGVLRPCQNGGRCNNIADGHICHCPPAWTGDNCTVPVDTCDKTPCHNNGTCSNLQGGGFQCSCAGGWHGQFCTQNYDECLIFDGGRSLCHFHGNCTDTPGSYHCTCDKGWTGSFCNAYLRECPSSPCLHNATCSDTPGGFNCACATGWHGDVCQYDVDECATLTPCQNNATCLNLNGTYECVCTESWDGQNCTLDINECESTIGVCSNGGTCQNTIGGYTCSCPPNWQGAKCSVDVNECSLYQPCQNNGTCINFDGGYSCNCTSAWKGLNCTENVNECTELLGTCAHGTCTDFPGGFNCSCFLGWQGKHCMEDVDECQNQDSCGNYSICINTLGAYHCQCFDGFTGHKCLINIDECKSSPCLNGGTCVDKIAHYKCICPNGWDDLNCQTDVNECLHFPCSSSQVCNNFPGSYSCETLSTTTQSTRRTTTTGSTSSTSSIVATSSSSSSSSSSSTLSTATSTRTTTTGSTSSLSLSTIKTSLSSSVRNTQFESTTTMPSSSTVPLSVDVFSLQFANPVATTDLPAVRNGIHDILKLLNCHDSSNVYVSLVDNSISNPKTVEFHAQCDGHHLTNEEINSAIRTLSDEKLLQYFPQPLKQLAPEPKTESWISSHMPIVGGTAGAVVLVIIIIIGSLIYRRRKNSKYQNGEQDIPQDSFVQPEIMFNMDGKERVVIANPTYDSLYQTQTQV